MASGPTSNLANITLPELSDLVRRDWFKTKDMVKPMAQKMFIYEARDPHSGNTVLYNEYDSQQYARTKLEGANVAKSLVGVGYSKLLVSKRIGTEIDITYEMRTQNRYPEVATSFTSLSQFCPQRTDLDLTHRITFATASSYVDMDGYTIDVTGGDGLPVAASNHTLAFSPITWSNLVPGAPAFSRAGLEAAELLTVTNILSNFGEKRTMKFNTIFSTDTPSVVNNIQELLRSTSSPSAPNSGVDNVYANKYKHIVLPQLATTATGAYDSAKQRWWGIAAVEQGLNGWQARFAEWEAPHLLMPASGNNGEDIHNENWTYGARAGYGIAIPSGKGFILSNPVS